MHLPEELRRALRENHAQCAFTVKNSRHQVGDPQFFFSELKYVNALLAQTLQPVRADFQLDFQMLETFQIFFERDFTQSRFLARVHRLLEALLAGVQVSKVNICAILQREYSVERPTNVSELLARKIEQMGAFFRAACLYKTPALQALQQLSNSRARAPMPEPDASQTASADFEQPQTFSQGVALFGDVFREGRAPGAPRNPIERQMDRFEITNIDSVPLDLEK